MAEPKPKSAQVSDVYGDRDIMPCQIETFGGFLKIS